jgi:predicted kinase
MKPTLYLMLGYPGAGKTTVARLVAQQTGAVHLWADDERHKMFAEPTHAHDENLELYKHLNTRADELLTDGKSVVFDTSFNLYKDRDHLRTIAERHGAVTVVIWVNTPRSTAQQRAVHSPVNRNGYMEGMDERRFDAIADKLELPTPDEKVIKIDGVKLDEQALTRLLQS